jgi:hypothetical protein
MCTQAFAHNLQKNKTEHVKHYSRGTTVNNKSNETQREQQQTNKHEKHINIFIFVNTNDQKKKTHTHAAGNQQHKKQNMYI